ncbi:MAG: CTP synthase, partial [Candidatus Izimaplasma sp.]|nr:CTP synthase [Candidatus Izimaplasma bacterium]
IITEIGGTVGDIESLPFLEAIRQARRDLGYNNTIYIHNTLVPYLESAHEMKTKPTQHSVKTLRGLGIAPDVIVLRTKRPITNSIREKIALFCDVRKEAVIEARDQKVLYEVALKLEEQNLDDLVLTHFNIETPPADLTEWRALVKTVKSLEHTVTIGLVGKYVSLQDAYLSVSEALQHAGYAYHTKVNIKWINAGELVDADPKDYLSDVDGIVVPGGFGRRAIEGKIHAVTYARENNIPYLGLCLGMQAATIEFARNVCHLENAHSTEFDSDTPHPVIDYLPEQYEGIDMGGTLRLGLYDCLIKEDTLAHRLYGKDVIAERHRHRYEFNNTYKEKLETCGLIFSGINPKTNLAEMIELKDHPFFIGSQFHPEFRSRPLRPHPLFKGLIKASLDKQ